MAALVTAGRAIEILAVSVEAAGASSFWQAARDNEVEETSRNPQSPAAKETSCSPKSPAARNPQSPAAKESSCSLRSAGAESSSCGLRPPRILVRDAVVMLAFLGLYVALTTLSGVGCPIRFVTGIPCPGCGMTHAWLAALSGDFAAALVFHPLFWAVPVAFVLAFVSRLPVWSARGRRLFTLGAAALLVAVIVVWLWRLASSSDFISVAKPAWLQLFGI